MYDQSVFCFCFCFFAFCFALKSLDISCKCSETSTQMEAFVYLVAQLYMYENNHCLLKLLHRFEYLFNFDNTFEIHDDIEVLKRMGMAFGLEKGQCAEANLRASRTMVPKALEPYVMGKFVR